MLTRPTDTEYGAFYANYIASVPEGAIEDLLVQQRDEVMALLDGLREEQANYRYAEGKWSIKEMVGHLLDAERVFAYRALRIARGDTTPLPGFDQDAYVEAAQFDERQLQDLADEYWHVRNSNLLMMHALRPEQGTLVGEASGASVSVRALFYIIAGHERHHLNILRERYLRHRA